MFGDPKKSGHPDVNRPKWGDHRTSLTLGNAWRITELTDDKTIAQLASLRYQHNARGQVVIESKEEARKRGVRSPDRAEAVMLAFAPEIPREVHGVVYYYDPASISPV
jgi:hypothetical protein